MYLGRDGLVIYEHKNKTGYIRWPAVHSAFKHMKAGKPWRTIPAHPFTREEAAYILAHYED